MLLQSIAFFMRNFPFDSSTDNIHSIIIPPSFSSPLRHGARRDNAASISQLDMTAGKLFLYSTPDQANNFSGLALFLAAF